MTDMTDIHILPTPANGRVEALGRDLIAGEQTVSHYEANIIHEAHQDRLRLAEEARPRLRALDGRLNQLDIEIAHAAGELAEARAEVAREGLHPATPQFPAPLFWVLMAVVLAGEWAVAKMGIDALGLADPIPAMLAATLGAITFFAAKSIARVARQWRHADRLEITLSAITTGLFLWLAISLAKLRAAALGNPDAGTASLAIILFCFATMLVLAALQTDPDRRAEGLARRIGRLEKQVHGPRGLWTRRRQIAERYNAARDRAELAMDRAAHDAIQRIAQYRNSNARWRTEPSPSWFAEPVTLALFPPISMGPAIEPEPMPVAALAFAQAFHARASDETFGLGEDR